MNLLEMMYIMSIVYAFKDIYLRLIFSYIDMAILALSLMLPLHVEAILILFFTFFDCTYVRSRIFGH